MKFILKKQQGAGLVETVVTLLIIAGAAISLLRFQTYLSFSYNSTQQQAYAVQLAATKIESLRDFTTMTGANSYASIVSGSSSGTAGATDYTTTWTVTPFTTPNYKVIDVVVSWTDSTNTARTVRLTSIVAGIDPSFSGVII